MAACTRSVTAAQALFDHLGGAAAGVNAAARSCALLCHVASSTTPEASVVGVNSCMVNGQFSHMGTILTHGDDQWQALSLTVNQAGSTGPQRMAAVGHAAG